MDLRDIVSKKLGNKVTFRKQPTPKKVPKQALKEKTPEIPLVPKTHKVPVRLVKQVKKKK